MCMCVHVCTFMFMSIRSQGTCCPPQLTPTLFFETGTLTNPVAHQLARDWGVLALFLSLPSWHLITCFYMDGNNPNSGLCAYMASAFTGCSISPAPRPAVLNASVLITVRVHGSGQVHRWALIQSPLPAFALEICPLRQSSLSPPVRLPLPQSERGIMTAGTSALRREKTGG